MSEETGGLLLPEWQDFAKLEGATISFTVRADGQDPVIVLNMKSEVGDDAVDLMFYSWEMVEFAKELTKLAFMADAGLKDRMVSEQQRKFNQAVEAEQVVKSRLWVPGMPQ